MNSYKNLLIRKVVLLSVFFFALSSCKKKENIIGAQLHDDKLNVSVIDSLSLITYGDLQDSLQSSGLSISTLGSYIDPVFGETKSSIYTHLRLSADNVNFAPSGSSLDIEIDSVVLALQFTDYYGTLDPQTFEVYEILDDLYTDSIYYSNHSSSLDLTNIVSVGFENITPNPNDKIYIDGDSLEPQLRIRIDNSFGQKIVNESGNSNISNNENFLQFIKGIYITTNSSLSSGQGAILSFDLLNSNSKMTIYYRDTVQKDTNSFDLLINSSCARVNNIQHDYTATAIESLVNDSSLGANEIYIQSLQGVRTFVEFPTLESLKDSNIIVNKAVLTMPVNYSGGNYTPIDQLLLLRNEDGEEFITPDQLTYGPTPEGIGGTWDEDNSQYEFTITRTINNILNGNNKNEKLTIQSSSQMVVPKRTVLYGSNGINKPKLTLTYTKY